jgi:hypothetical protein
MGSNNVWIFFGKAWFLLPRLKWIKKLAASPALGLPVNGEPECMDFHKNSIVSGAQAEMGKTNAASQAVGLPFYGVQKCMEFIRTSMASRAQAEIEENKTCSLPSLKFTPIWMIKLCGFPYEYLGFRSPG